MRRLLNVGCGACVHPEWVNVDLAALAPGVLVLDIRQELPFGADEFDAVYHSHLLEHLARKEAAVFLRECWRILKPGGILRVVVPDLEAAARAYLRALDDDRRGVDAGAARHDWMIVELIDQMVRERGGGDMLDAIRAATPETRNFIRQRLGLEIVTLVDRLGPPARTLRQRSSLQCWVGSCCNIIRDPMRLKEVAIRRLLGREYELLELGRFRRCGELHRWMYDEVTLVRLLESCGFVAVRRVQYAESAIDGWHRYALDQGEGGASRKPDSLYVECQK